MRRRLAAVLLTIGVAAAVQPTPAAAAPPDKVYESYDDRGGYGYLVVEGHRGHLRSEFSFEDQGEGRVLVHSARSFKTDCEAVDEHAVSCRHYDFLIAETRGGADSVDAGDAPVEIGGYLGAGADELIGTAYDDFVRAGAGPDDVRTGALEDTVIAGPGDDRITPGTGIDQVLGKGGDDFIDLSDRQPDRHADCGPGEDVVVLDRFDRAGRNCETVRVESPGAGA